MKISYTVNDTVMLGWQYCIMTTETVANTSFNKSFVFIFQFLPSCHRKLRIAFFVHTSQY